MITSIGFEHDSFTYPCGEVHIRVKDYKYNARVNILWNFEKTDEVMQVLLMVDACRRAGLNVESLSIYYVPFSRQDRVMVEGDCLSIKVFADLVNTMKLKEIYIIDPHSDVTSALIDNVTIRTQEDVFKKYFEGKTGFFLISPDAGALKKIHKLAKLVKPVATIECSKVRDVETGEISGVDIGLHNFNGRDCYIVDDICDGGSITIDRCMKICKGLELKGFASTNVVFGIGSYTYQHVTRDTFGFAVKSTFGVIAGKDVQIWKDPKTDDGEKKSAKGLLMVDEDLQLHEGVSWEEEEQGILQTVFEDGKIVKEYTLNEIRMVVKEGALCQT